MKKLIRLLFDLLFFSFVLFEYFYLGNNMNLNRLSSNSLFFSNENIDSENGVIPFNVKSDGEIIDYEMKCNVDSFNKVDIIVESYNDVYNIYGNLRIKNYSDEDTIVTYNCNIIVNSKS